MYLNYGERLVYLASPRTASTATSEALKKQAGFAPYRDHHGGFRENDVLRRSDWKAFTVVRNPWDTVVSWAFWNSKPVETLTPDFIEETLMVAHKWISYYKLFLLADQADVICRFENLESDLSAVVGKPLTLHPKNVSEWREKRPYQEFYTPEGREYVAERFNSEITKWGYTFDEKD